MGLSMWKPQIYSRNPLLHEERGAGYPETCWTLPSGPSFHLPPLFSQGPVSTAQGGLYALGLEWMALVSHVPLTVSRLTYFDSCLPIFSAKTLETLVNC